MAKRNVGLGFVISAVDKASKEFRGFGKNVTGSLGSIKAALMMQHPALAILRTGWRLVSRAISDAVKTALEFQTGDVRAEFDEFGKSVRLVTARIGDALLPTVRAFMEAMKPTVDGVRAWLTANNKLVASKVLDWSISIARFLVNYVVPALSWVAKGFLGIRMVIDLVMLQWNKFNEILSMGWEKILGTLGRLARLVGADGLAGGLEEAANFAGAWREAFAESAQGNTDDIYASVDAIGTLTAGSKTLRVALENIVSDAALNGQRNLQTSVVGGTTSLKEQEDQAKANKAALDELAEAEKRLDAARRLARQKAAAYKAEEEREQKESNDRMAAATALARQRAQEAREAHVERTMQNMEYAQSIGAVFGAMASGEMKQADAAKAAQLVILDIIEREIMAYAARAAASAASANAGVPVIGPVLGAAAAAAMFAIIRGYLAKFHDGGIVGGRRGQERVILALAGEEVLTEKDPRHQNNLESMRPASAGARRRAASDETRESIKTSTNRTSSAPRTPSIVSLPRLDLTIVMPSSVVPDSEVAFERKSSAILRRVQRALESGELLVPSSAVVG